MDNTRLQDDEIIAAMESCYSDDDFRLCAQCPLMGMGLAKCKELLGSNALDLIYRLRMED